MPPLTPNLLKPKPSLQDGVPASIRAEIQARLPPDLGKMVEAFEY